MFKLITCIASEDKAPDVIKGLEEHFGIQAVVYHFARGFGRSSPMAARGMGQQTEKVTIKVMVETERADDVFAYIFHAADLNQPHGGIIYVNAVLSANISPSAKKENMERAIHALE